MLERNKIAYLTGFEGDALDRAMLALEATFSQNPLPDTEEDFRYFVGFITIESGYPNLSKVDKAARTAAAAHGRIDQRRKSTGEPYIWHPKEVASIVASVTDDEDMIAAAWLHDTIEDAGLTRDALERIVGADCAQLVDDLTDVSRPEDGNRAIRKEIDLQHTAKASPRAKTIKLADLISNSRSIVEHGGGFASVYLQEKAKLMEVLKEGHPVLYEKAMEVLRVNLARIKNASKP